MNQKDPYSLTDQEPEEDTQEGKYLTFVLGDEDYGLAIRYVTEIIGIQKITPVPDLPGYIKGVINLRGKVIPVMDVRLRFRMDPRDYDARTCIVVIHAEETTVGLIVDTVSEVLEIDAEQIEEARQVRGGYGNQFMHGMGKVGDRVKILLDAEALLFKDTTDIKQMAGSAPE
ncbi:Purine-binding chemotaxis protein CheW [Sulfidibacter corallicola]|uniref:Chemotaxis protein CheW n=1 Tax=Sulfidibacter corallicola TaxID=2818388 RepID=A0A8A4TDI1_SULCO|nr:chemotaxis protein CheW [Sulfidibacter corallicola]QTD47627.1 purine-binding chemotaxis protein CheW [Sulfidibacter corallicola]